MAAAVSRSGVGTRPKETVRQRESDREVLTRSLGVTGRSSHSSHTPRGGGNDQHVRVRVMMHVSRRRDQGARDAIKEARSASESESEGTSIKGPQLAAAS